MGSHSLVVYFPGRPFALENLVPNRDVALAAAIIRLHGNSAIILDFGTTEYPQWSIPKGFRESKSSGKQLRPISAISQPWRSFQAAWSARIQEREWGRARYFAISRALAQIEQHLPVQSVTFYIGSIWDVEPALALGRALRHGMPDAIFTAFGPFADMASLGRRKSASPFHATSGEFDFACAVAPGNRPMNWTRDGFPTDGAAENDISARTGTVPIVPCYDPDVYPALADGRKFSIFRVPDGRQDHADIGGQNVRDLESSVQSEISVLENKLGVSAVFVDTIRALGGGPGKSSSQCGSGMLPVSLGFTFPILRDHPRSRAISMAIPEVASLQIHSGSQRLLDLAFKGSIAVSAIETEIRLLRSQGAFVVTRLDFPTLDDDYHTACETLRLLARAKPDAAIVRIPGTRARQLQAKSRTNRDDAERFGDPGRIPSGVSGLPGPECRCRGELWGASSIATRDAATSAFSLRYDLEEQGIQTNLTEEFILVARQTGYAAREKEFADILASLLIQGDGAALTELARSFQRSVRSRAAANAGMLYAGRRVVGN